LEKAILCLVASKGNQLQSAIEPAAPAQPPYTPAPDPVRAMMELRDFIDALARKAKNLAGVKLEAFSAYGDKTPSNCQKNCIIKAIKYKKKLQDEKDRPTSWLLSLLL
jgi:hypothetical protein